jgi:hypothetical protein
MATTAIYTRVATNLIAGIDVAPQAAGKLALSLQP